MFPKYRFVGGLLCAAALLLTILALLPSAAASANASPTATPTPTFTPKQQAQADRYKAKYQQLRSDMYGLSDLYAQAAGYRRSYVTFMNGQAVNHFDTTELESELAYYDALITQGQSFQQKGFDDLAYPNGFDASGQNVVNINVVSNEINAALPDYLTSRGYVTTAIYVLHSGLNLYHQISGFDVPNVPKYHAPGYCLGCATATPVASASTSSADPQASTGSTQDQAMAVPQDPATVVPNEQAAAFTQAQEAAVMHDQAAANTQARGNIDGLQFFFDQAAGYLNTVWREILTGLHSFLASRV